MSEPTTATEKVDATEIKVQVNTLVAEGKKAIALKDWEQGAEKYGEALALMREIVGEFDPAMAPLLLSYGKALYELAFSTQGVMGKEEVDKVAIRPGGNEDSGPAISANFVFEGDGDDVVDEEGENAQAGPSNPQQEVAQEIEEQEEGGDEPEDDYNAAWEVLDVARTIYAKVVEEKGDKEDQLNLAECYLALGDVSLETENFPQAAQDYTEALRIKSQFLAPSSRALASVHYQLATVLEFTPSGRSAALTHVQTALEGFQARLKELDGKEPLSEELAKMTEKDRANEKKDVEGLITDLLLKIEELKSAPEAQDPVSESIKHLLGQGGESAFGPSSAGTSNPFGGDSSAPVNDLTGMVKKKKRVQPQQPAAEQVQATGAGEKGKAVENGEKRKADADIDADAKKPKTE